MEYLPRKIPALFLALWLSLTLCGCPAGDPAPTGMTSEYNLSDTETGGLTVHFIDVGQADCALVQCGGENMLIDGGNVDDSSLVSAYLSAHGVDTIRYMICTHAHEDHVGGLSGPLNTCTVEQVFCPVTEYQSAAFSNFLKYTAGQGLELTMPEPDTIFSLGGAQMTILGPRAEYEETNDTSIVLRVDYGATSFLFTGDMQAAAEQELLAADCQLDATVLKVGHHGSNTSTSYAFLREVMPEYAVISLGRDNDYGFPSESVLSRLYDAQATVYRTDQQGTVIAVSDGESVTFTTEQNVAPALGRDEAQWDAVEGAIIGNVKSLIYHVETCPNLPAEYNRIYFNCIQDAANAGYHPCGNCCS